MEESNLDSYIRIQVSADKLSAYLTFSRLNDEFQCLPEQLERYVRSHGVLYGLRLDVIGQIAKNPIVYYKEQTLIAQGEPVREGKDGSIKMVHDMELEPDHRPVELQDGKVDFKEIVQLKNVKRGQLVAERMEPQLGLPGKTVTGEELPPKAGKQARIKAGKNVVLNGDQSALYSAIDGLVTMTDKDKINVFPVYEVNGDVDYRTGNIDFVGTVVIRGNVLTGFKVKASGDIRVVGGVEGAELESEGSIEITGGILASNKGLVKAGKNVKSSFIQDGNVVAGEDVLVGQSIMHSHVRAGRSVICLGSKGLIVGGSVQAGDLVKARTIGNTMATVTAIEVGVKPEYRQELGELRSKIKSLMDSLDKTDKALVLLDQLASLGQLTPDKMALRIKLTATKRQSQLEMDETRERILDIERTLENAESAKVDVLSTVYGGTKIVIGRYTRFVKDSAARVSFRFSEGDIVLLPYY
ncbi:DUF342 domain-containing protein [Paenibacillus sp. GCM10023252]|uniref:DUF342 domain-containing protein n=1 Tax=Paenibacillus sp. GCM10023252 TaxID=3252649 RepID=UPI0036127CDC